VKLLLSLGSKPDCAYGRSGCPLELNIPPGYVFNLETMVQEVELDQG
jgi:hypothetical protein